VSKTALYTYWRSTAAYRVRIALNLKGVDYTSVPVHLLRDGGEQKTPAFLARNPQGLVPVLSVGEDDISQSLAIVEFLEETTPEPPLLPADPAGRARVRGLAMAIACDIHPICNLRVLQFLSGDLGLSDEQRSMWIRHWITEGFRAIETRLVNDGSSGEFCHGDQPGLADICLVPQVYNAQRFACPMDPFPAIARINASCLELAAFSEAVPENQPDAS
jgi:maleylacetoacetate isomerase